MHTEYLVNNIFIQAKEIHGEANHVYHEPERESCWCPVGVEEVGAVRERAAKLN